MEWPGLNLGLLWVALLYKADRKQDFDTKNTISRSTKTEHHSIIHDNVLSSMFVGWFIGGKCD